MNIGLFNLPWWAYVVVTLCLTHVTIAAVTIFLHRQQAHHALSLHPVVSHFFRFWLWLTTGMMTKEWVAIHRKHHANTDTTADPHSPQIYGIRKVLFEGAELYRIARRSPTTIEKYGHCTPDDWIERKLYAKHTVLGLSIMLTINLVLFGPIGLTIWAVQMLWIPFCAAGVINGIGHYWGYRNFVPNDASRNILPWGILMGGEELHNNHHAYISSAKFSARWWEFDLGWGYIRILALFHLAKVLRIPPKIHYNIAKINCDPDTLQTVITHRYDVLARFIRAMQRAAKDEIHNLRVSAIAGLKEGSILKLIKRGLQREPMELPEQERTKLYQMIQASKTLATIYTMRQDLTALWSHSSATKAQLLRQLEDWCQRAETSGIAALQEFSRTLRRSESINATTHVMKLR